MGRRRPWDEQGEKQTISYLSKIRRNLDNSIRFHIYRSSSVSSRDINHWIRYFIHAHWPENHLIYHPVSIHTTSIALLTNLSSSRSLNLPPSLNRTTQYSYEQLPQNTSRALLSPASRRHRAVPTADQHHGTIAGSTHGSAAGLSKKEKLDDVQALLVRTYTLIDT